MVTHYENINGLAQDVKGAGRTRQRERRTGKKSISRKNCGPGDGQEK